jgi:hypothetical protein
MMYGGNGKRVDAREECHWVHVWQRFKRAGVGTNGILESKFLPKKAHRALLLGEECSNPNGC